MYNTYAGSQNTLVQEAIEYGLLLAVVAVLVVLLASTIVYPGPPRRPNPLGCARSACTLALITQPFQQSR
jgi:hypothetical protein